jgi:hypothetical protein
MSIYVIARKGESFLDTPVFHAGSDDDQEAIAVFTEPGLAESYLEDAGWKDEYEVGELRPIQMLRWFAMAYEDGSDLVAINPIRGSQKKGERQHVVDLSEPLKAFARTLRAKLDGTEASTGPHPIQHALAQQNRHSHGT